MKNCAVVIMALSFATLLVLGKSVVVAGPPTGVSKEEPHSVTIDQATPRTPANSEAMGEGARGTTTLTSELAQYVKPGDKGDGLKGKPDYDLPVDSGTTIEPPDVKEILDCESSDVKIVSCDKRTSHVAIFCVGPGKARITIRYLDNKGNKRVLHVTVHCK